ncbi:MAG TPA: uroporphyrinogen decarboxylase family protein [Spirochaetia bacterium]|nr:uroporphyrinogen decarboxylase family protein [Spirochaetia bacterium]
MAATFERLFEGDRISKRERVGLTLRHQPVDRAALHDQLSYSPSVIEMYTGRRIQGFSYGPEEIGQAIRKTLDMCFPLVPPIGTDRVTDPDGFVSQRDNWTSWHVSRPFDTVDGALAWVRRLIERERERSRLFDADRERDAHRALYRETQKLIGETVLCAFSMTGFCGVFDRMGLELYSFFTLEHPTVLSLLMEIATDNEVRRVRAVADPALSPLILLPEDFSTKQGPIFSPEFLHRFHYPYVRRLVDAWHEAGIKVLYHSDGNYKKAIPDLMACGVDGFYCLEPGCGMDIVELKLRWPHMVWAGGVDGVDTMERGTPADVRRAVHHHIQATDALRTGGMFVASSSEINPPIRAENYRAMVEAAGALVNDSFRLPSAAAH